MPQRALRDRLPLRKPLFQMWLPFKSHLKNPLQLWKLRQLWLMRRAWTCLKLLLNRSRLKPQSQRSETNPPPLLRHLLLHSPLLQNLPLPKERS